MSLVFDVLLITKNVDFFLWNFGRLGPKALNISQNFNICYACYGRLLHTIYQWRSQWGAAAPSKGLIRKMCLLFLHGRHYCELRHR